MVDASDMPQETAPPSLEAELAALGIPSTSPAEVLRDHIDTLPLPLLKQLGERVPPRERSRIPRIRQRRHVWAHSAPPPPSSSTSPHFGALDEPPSGAAAAVQGTGQGLSGGRPRALTAGEGRIRWPLLWEQLGGDPAAVPQTEAQTEEMAWAREGFMPGSTQHVGKLAAMLGEVREMEAWEAAARNRARERRLQAQGEEFDDSDSDAEPTDAPSTQPGAHRLPGLGGAPGFNRDGPLRNQQEVAEEFERRLLELFLDGLDTLDYDGIDFAPADDPIAARDAEEAYFDDEAPSHGEGSGNGHGAGARATENGQGEYDY